MASSRLTPLDEKRFRAAFEVIDTDGDGVLSLAELKAALLPGALTEADIEEIFRDFDANGDGQLQFEELVVAWAALGLEAPVRSAVSIAHESHKTAQAILDAASADNTGLLAAPAEKAAGSEKVEHASGEAAADRTARAAYLTQPESIFAALRAGDVILLRSSWLLARAGLKRVEEGEEDRKRVRYEVCGEALPLPSRQEIEAKHPEAILPAHELEAIHRGLKQPAKGQVVLPQKITAHELEAIHRGLKQPVKGHVVEGLPVVAISHCWHAPEHPGEGRMPPLTPPTPRKRHQLCTSTHNLDLSTTPTPTPMADPNATTLRMVALGLAGQLAKRNHTRRRLTPAPGKLQMADRSACEQFSYEDCGFTEVGVFFDFASMYQNKPTPRTAAQENCFKRALSNMSIWYAHRLTTVCVVDGQEGLVHYEMDSAGGLHPTDRPNPREGRGWPSYEGRCSTLLVEAGAGGWLRVFCVGAGAKAAHAPPLAPSRFAAELAAKHFTGKGDREVVGELYHRTMEDGFGGLQRLQFKSLGWGDAEVAELAATLQEVRCPSVVELDLSYNELTSLEALGGAIDVGALGALTTLDLRSCERLTSLPESLGQLSALTTLDLSYCKGLTSLPESLDALTSLDLSGCSGLTSLPDWLGQLVAQTTLNLWGCTSLTSLPESLGQLGALTTLDLSDCKGLTSLPESLGQLGALTKLEVRGCAGLTSLPDLSGLSKLEIEYLPDKLQPWETGGRKAWDFVPPN